MQCFCGRWENPFTTQALPTSSSCHSSLKVKLVILSDADFSNKGPWEIKQAQAGRMDYSRTVTQVNRSGLRSCELEIALGPTGRVFMLSKHRVTTSYRYPCALRLIEPKLQLFVPTSVCLHLLLKS